MNAASLDALVIGEPDECWGWTGTVNSSGYGPHHRAVYELVNGSAAGLDVDHLCRNRRCANPRHLEAVPHSVNIARGDVANRRKTHCPQGHAYDSVQTWRDSRSGKTVEARRCTTCREAQGRAKYQRARELVG